MEQTNFSNIIGQDFAVKLLRRGITSDAISHAYLFVGAEGVGKTTTALALAAALNCESRKEDGDSCGECWSCRAIAEDRHPDIEMIAPETDYTKIDQMREMRRQAVYRPIRSPRKVIIIERADSLNEDSASAILKILEEPPSYAVIILLTRNISSVLPTIVSRCQVVRFRQANMDILRSALMERFGADEEKADFLARYSEGRPGRAISLIEDEEFFTRRASILDIARRAGAGPKALALRLAEEFRKACASGDKPKKKGKKPAADAPPIDEEAAEDAKAKAGRREIRQGIDTLILWYRDLVSLALAGHDAPVINLDRREELLQTLPGIAPTSARSILESLSWAKRAIESNANPQLITEVVMMRMIQQ